MWIKSSHLQHCGRQLLHLSCNMQKLGHHMNIGLKMEVDAGK